MSLNERNMGTLLMAIPRPLSSFLLLLSNLFLPFLMASLAPLLFLLLHRCHYHYGIQSSALLQFKNSFLLFHDKSTSFHCDFFFKKNFICNSISWNSIICQDRFLDKWYKLLSTE